MRWSKLRAVFALMGCLVVMILLVENPTPILAEPPRPQPIPPAEILQKDPELASLFAKYEALVRDRVLSPQELAELIANDRNEKARLLGIRVEYSTHARFSSADNIQPLSVCIRPPFGPGKVVWNFSNPGQNGARYSVLPEGGNSLIWARPPEQAVDGIYRAGWGSCTAYKIPDSATATFHTADSWSVCYNAAACFVNRDWCPKWVNPCDNNSPEGSWPDHPLR